MTAIAAANEARRDESDGAFPLQRRLSHVGPHRPVLNFGGPTAQIALMHRVIVEEKKWLDEPHYLSALSFCMLLPGPEAMQLATYVGWRLHGLKGGPRGRPVVRAARRCVVLALSMIYAAFGNVPVVEAIFFGIKAAVLVIVIEALLRIAKRALKCPAALGHRRRRRSSPFSSLRCRFR